MNLLDIMKLANTFCGLQDTIDTVASLKDVQMDLYNFVRQANIQIQLMRDNWKFMNATYVVATDGTDSITNTEVAKWVKIFYSKKSLVYVPYDEYLEEDNWDVPGVPTRFTIVPETNEVITNQFDATYTLTARYIRNPVDISQNADVSIIPERFHSLIAYKASAAFGSWLGNVEIEDRNQLQTDILMGQLLRSECPASFVNLTPMA